MTEENNNATTEHARLYEGGTGVRFPNGCQKLDEALELADMNFEVLKQTLYMPTSFGKVAVPDFKALVRSDNPNTPLGVVGKRYEVIQPREMLQSVWPMIESGEAQLDTLGGFRNNAEIFASLKFGDAEIVPGDTVEQFLTMTNSFNNSGSMRAFLNSNRLACMNQLQAIQSQAGDLFQRIRHTSAGVARLASTIAYLRRMQGFMADEIDIYKMLTKVKLTDEIVNGFLKFIFPDRVIQRNSDAVVAKLEAIYEEMLENNGREPKNSVLATLMQLPESAIEALRAASDVIPDKPVLVLQDNSETATAVANGEPVSEPTSVEEEVERQTYSERRREQVLELSETSPGAEHAKGTLWSLVNGVTYYCDHVRNQGNPENRMKSALTGWASRLKKSALRKAKTIAEEVLDV